MLWATAHPQGVDQEQPLLADGDREDDSDSDESWGMGWEDDEGASPRGRLASQYLTPRVLSFVGPFQGILWTPPGEQQLAAAALAAQALPHSSCMHQLSCSHVSMPSPTASSCAPLDGNAITCKPPSAECSLIHDGTHTTAPPCLLLCRPRDAYATRQATAAPSTAARSFL